MWNFLRLVLFAGLLLVAGAAALPVSAQQTCLATGEARNAAAAARITPLSVLRAKIAAMAGGEVVSAQLCQGPAGKWVYRVNVLTRKGAVVAVMVDAESGAPVN